MIVDARSTEKIHGTFPPMREKLSKNPNFRILFRFWTKNWYFFTCSGPLKKYIVVDAAPFIDGKYKCQTFRASFQYSHFNAWDVLSDFFFKNHVKNQSLFFKSDGFQNRKGRAIAWHAFLASPVKNSRVTRFVRKTEKKFENRVILERF